MENNNEAQAINDYIAAKNAELEAKAKASGAIFWCTCALTAEDLVKYGVRTLKEYIEWVDYCEECEREKDARKSY